MTTILLKRSTQNSVPASLQFGELAYSQISDTLFIGLPDTTIKAIGGLGVFAPINNPEFTGTLNLNGIPVLTKNDIPNSYFPGGW